MPYNWAELLHLARFLQKGAGGGYSEQAAFRSAVSRAYFAAYNHACVYAENNLGFQRTQESTDHARLRKLFQAKGNPELASLLDDLRVWRNTSDYDDTKPIRLITAMVAPSITKAQDVINRLT